MIHSWEQSACIYRAVTLVLTRDVAGAVCRMVEKMSCLCSLRLGIILMKSALLSFGSEKALMESWGAHQGAPKRGSIRKVQRSMG
jgi:hypothetical protein